MELAGLIVGLGNPGNEYAYTRHNFGFWALDAVLREFDRSGSVHALSDKKKPFLLWRCTDPVTNKQWLAAKPLTYMNRSGEAVQAVSRYYHIPPASVLVLHDEVDLPLGRMRLKQGGGTAGHNGLKSIQQHLGIPDFYRLRLGIGKPSGYDTSSFVLGKISQQESLIIQDMLPAIVEGVFLFLRKDFETAQRFCNSYTQTKE